MCLKNCGRCHPSLDFGFGRHIKLAVEDGAIGAIGETVKMMLGGR